MSALNEIQGVIDDVLGLHRHVIATNGRLSHCTCEWFPKVAIETLKQHRDHVAQEITRALTVEIGLRIDTRPMQHEGDTFADSCVRNSLAAAFQKWPDFAHEERLVTDWIEVIP